MKLPKKQCSSCPFLGNGLPLTPKKMAEIYGYLIEGQNHLCHSDRSNKTVCVGGREWQLKMWCSMGWIEEPTNESLARAMQSAGVKPKKHIIEDWRI